MLSHGAKLRMLRKQKGLTQSELAKLAGLSQSLVARIEKGTVDPRVSTLNSLFSVLEKKTESLSRILSSPVIYSTPEELVSEIISKMEKYNISQVPVMEKSKQIGVVLDSVLVKKMKTVPLEKIAFLTAKEVMRKPLPEIDTTKDVSTITTLLSKEPAIIVKNEGLVVGIITRADLLRRIK